MGVLPASVPVVAYLLASTTLKLMLMVLRGRGLPVSNSLPEPETVWSQLL